MFIHTFLQQVKESIFQPPFMDSILEIHADNVAKGEYSIEIRDYNKSMPILLATLNEEEKKLLAEYEDICQSIRELWAQHGFIAGIYAGFRHIFTQARDMDAGYGKYVMDEMMMQANIPRHPELQNAVMRRHELYEQLAEGRVENCDSPMVCISCYWDEMASSAGAIAFYSGYRAAGSLADQFGLMETDYMERTSKLLMLEHAFGYIESVAERERRLEREQSGIPDEDEE